MLSFNYFIYKEFVKENNFINDLINIIKSNPNISIKDLFNQLNIAERTIRYQIDKLKKVGVIKRDGSTKSGKWIVIK